MPDAVSLVELSVDQQATRILMPIAARRQLNDLPNEFWTRLSIEFNEDAADAVFKALDDKQGAGARVDRPRPDGRLPG